MKSVIKIRPMTFTFMKHSLFYCNCEHRKQNKFQVTERTFYFIMVSKNYENSIGSCLYEPGAQERNFYWILKMLTHHITYSIKPLVWRCHAGSMLVKKVKIYKETCKGKVGEGFQDNIVSKKSKAESQEGKSGESTV